MFMVLLKRKNANKNEVEIKEEEHSSSKVTFIG